MSLFLRSLIRNALGITGHSSVQNGAYHDVGKACFWYDEDWLKSGLIRFERGADTSAIVVYEVALMVFPE
jgi:hypothetical protein